MCLHPECVSGGEANAAKLLWTPDKLAAIIIIWRLGHTAQLVSLLGGSWTDCVIMQLLIFGTQQPGFNREAT